MDITTKSLQKSFARFLQRYHVTIFTVVILGGLAFVVFSLNNIIAGSSLTSTDYTPVGASSTFDQETIDRVNALSSREENASELDLSQGRTNPFIEK